MLDDVGEEPQIVLDDVGDVARDFLLERLRVDQQFVQEPGDDALAQGRDTGP
ncbi:hypothetical protein ACFWFB_32065 [Streptomyces albidoflavus]|uniref:hypothetical protein n=1 Tax=Micromonospora aurantiaca (nom. illeg.) TaxID=47850 RepID=UPI0036652E99